MTEPLPSGIVTFLFTDIEGSTKRLAAVGDSAWIELLAQESSLVLDAARAAGGVPFGSEGDAHFVAFASAAAGIRGAVAAQRALASDDWGGEPLRVRMGLHTGEAVLVGADYAGFEVHRAARVAAVGHGGQVLLTEATRLLAGEPDSGVTLRDLGEHRLKDVAHPERIYQVEAPGLESTFPALRSLESTPNNLPSQLTSFVGRAEVAAAVGHLERSRLLTLTGPGGTGKTRLSIAVATEVADRFPGGSWFVPLAAISDPDLIGATIAGTLGVLSAAGMPLERVLEYLRDRHALLVLDNFEQVVAGAPVVARILEAAPRVTVIVSSRAPLRIAGEQEFPVPPLRVPPAGATDPAEIGASEAVRLFVERARGVRPDFSLTADNAPHVAAIVRRLDGLPLAIELAAARIRLLSPAAMAARLGDRLGLLSAGGRDLPERQRTLRGAIDWSYDLLGEEQRALFARLGVFAGSGELTMAEALCVLPTDEPPISVLEGIEGLAEQSLVRVAPDPHEDIRFTMLDTIREYAVDRLAASGIEADLRERHAEAFLALVRTATGDASGTHDRGDWLDRVEDDHDNVRAALDWWIASGNHTGAATLLAAVWRFWQMRNHLSEGRARAATVLDMPGWADAPLLDRVHALESAGGLAYWAGDMGAANGFYAEAVDTARRAGDEGEIANALYNNFFATRMRYQGANDYVSSLAWEGRPFLDEALAIWERLGDEDGIAKALWALAEHHAYRGEYPAAIASATRALAIFERKGSSFWIAWAHFTRGFAYAAQPDVVPACADLGVALREFQETGDISGMALVLAAGSSALLMAGWTAEAYAMGGASNRAVAETGLHLAALWPDTVFPIPDFETADPTLRAAIAKGDGWSREEAVERALTAIDMVAAGSLGPDYRA
jgi:predicted ATPase/class 3 adenylate cyclase